MEKKLSITEPLSLSRLLSHFSSLLPPLPRFSLKSSSLPVTNLPVESARHLPCPSPLSLLPHPSSLPHERLLLFSLLADDCIAKLRDFAQTSPATSVGHLPRPPSLSLSLFRPSSFSHEQLLPIAFLAGSHIAELVEILHEPTVPPMLAIFFALSLSLPASSSSSSFISPSQVTVAHLRPCQRPHHGIRMLGNLHNFYFLTSVNSKQYKSIIQIYQKQVKAKEIIAS